MDALWRGGQFRSLQKSEIDCSAITIRCTQLNGRKKLDIKEEKKRERWKGVGVTETGVLLSRRPNICECIFPDIGWKTSGRNRWYVDEDSQRYQNRPILSSTRGQNSYSYLCNQSKSRKTMSCLRSAKLDENERSTFHLWKILFSLYLYKCVYINMRKMIWPL